MTQTWIISDGKPGHLNQSLGLAEALQRCRSNIDITIKPALGTGQALKTWLFGGGKGGPDLLIGAGHRTHLSLLAYKRATGAPAILMMKPSLPVAWFDLCLIPRHDKPAPRDNVILTDGALNRMQPGEKRIEQGMILIGGPSRHFGWDDQQVVTQLKQIIDGSKAWLLTTSRRTPDSFLRVLEAAVLPRLEIVPFQESGPGWLAQHLPKADQCWVSSDSVSMVFEALTAGCAVGVLELPQQQSSRITEGVQLLFEGGKVTSYSRWLKERSLPYPQASFNEAERCAALICERWLR